jgi:hypothetical protein
MESKHSWYRRWELVELKHSLVAVWRRYCHMYSIPKPFIFRGGLPDSVRLALRKASVLWVEGYRWDHESRQMELKIKGSTLKVLRALEDDKRELDNFNFRERLTLRYLQKTAKKSNPTFSPIKHRLFLMADAVISFMVRLG